MKDRLPTLEQLQKMNEARVVYSNPTDGVVDREKDATHKYSFDIVGERVEIDIENYGYLTEKPIKTHITADFDDIRKWIKDAAKDGQEIIGVETDDEISGILRDFPDSFIETVVWLYGNYSGKEYDWQDINESLSVDDVRGEIRKITSKLTSSNYDATHEKIKNLLRENGFEYKSSDGTIGLKASHWDIWKRGNETIKVTTGSNAAGNAYISA